MCVDVCVDMCICMHVGMCVAGPCLCHLTAKLNHTAPSHTPSHPVPKSAALRLLRLRGPPLSSFPCGMGVFPSQLLSESRGLPSLRLNHPIPRAHSPLPPSQFPPHAAVGPILPHPPITPWHTRPSGPFDLVNTRSQKKKSRSRASHFGCHRPATYPSFKWT